MEPTIHPHWLLWHYPARDLTIAARSMECMSPCGEETIMEKGNYEGQGDLAAMRNEYQLAVALSDVFRAEPSMQARGAGIRPRILGEPEAAPAIVGKLRANTSLLIGTPVTRREKTCRGLWIGLPSKHDPRNMRFPILRPTARYDLRWSEVLARQG
jgi:hypothetical protein